ncbi:MAG: arginine--tRNA ligase, partial [Candidatus Doudnabacteria bacterium]|nr:arginine--tRNA ligase [Candidatus Doudnabacteria bacterium]
QELSKAIAQAQVLGGFVNVTLSDLHLLRELEAVATQGDAYGSINIGQGKRVVVEYFQNNVAKPPHVGHLRSAVIGDSVKRLFSFLGYNAVSDTHVGDWGVQFGILLYAFKTVGNRAVVEPDPIQELNKLYVAMSARIETEPELREQGKQEFVKLEQGDSENRELWQWFVDVSLADFERYRELLGLLPFDYNLGESFYEDKMQAVLQDLQQKGLVSTGETGELYVDLEADGLGRCILVKSDGGTTYHLRDFATYIYRKDVIGFWKNVYVVDVRQAHHFKQLFKVLEKAGYPTATDSQHVDFGFMGLPEGAISTRKGNVISLEALVSEGVSRARAIITEKNPDLANKDEVAQQVALAAIKYFDLMHNRQSNIVFTWDKALSFEGNTGPYLQYTHARIYGIARKASAAPVASTAPYALNAYERAVLQKILTFSEVLEQAAQEYYPNLLANYLFELAQIFNRFYEAVPVNQESDPIARQYRTHLCSATAQVIKNGLYILGIAAPQEM